MYLNVTCKSKVTIFISDMTSYSPIHRNTHAVWTETPAWFKRHVKRWFYSGHSNSNTKRGSIYTVYCYTLCRAYMCNKIISAFDDVVWNNFITAHGNLPEIISQAYYSWIFCNMFIDAEIILKLLQWLKSFYSSFMRGYTWNI